MNKSTKHTNIAHNFKPQLVYNLANPIDNCDFSCILHFCISKCLLKKCGALQAQL